LWINIGSISKLNKILNKLSRKLFNKLLHIFLNMADQKVELLAPASTTISLMNRGYSSIMTVVNKRQKKVKIKG